MIRLFGPNMRYSPPSALTAPVFGLTARYSGFDTHSHKPPHCPARNKAAHEWQKPVQAADNLDHAPILKRLQSRFHDLFRSKARQSSEKTFVVSEHVEFCSDR